MKFDANTDPSLLSKWERAVREAERERDKARAEVARLYDSRAFITERYEEVEAERDALEEERATAVARLQALRADAQRLLRAAEFHVARDERGRYRELHDAVVSMREALATLEDA